MNEEDSPSGRPGSGRHLLLLCARAPRRLGPSGPQSRLPHGERHSERCRTPKPDLHQGPYPRRKQTAPGRRQGLFLYDTPNGRYWIPTRSKYVLPFNLAEQARDIYGRDGHGVKSGEIVLDCGANVGVFTRHALRAGAAKVVAIEPAPENIECLRRNFSGEIAAGRVIVYPKGVWDKDDILELHIDPTNSAADSFVIDKQGWDHVERVPSPPLINSLMS